MTTAVEQIREQASHLSYDEREALVRTLELDLADSTATDEDPGEIEAAWNDEIVDRLRAFEGGKIKTLSAEESDQCVEALFASLGIRRPA